MQKTTNNAKNKQVVYLLKMYHFQDIHYQTFSEIQLSTWEILAKQLQVLKLNCFVYFCQQNRLLKVRERIFVYILDFRYFRYFYVAQSYTIGGVQTRIRHVRDFPQHPFLLPKRLKFNEYKEQEFSRRKQIELFFLSWLHEKLNLFWSTK